MESLSATLECRGCDPAEAISAHEDLRDLGAGGPWYQVERPVQSVVDGTGSRPDAHGVPSPRLDAQHPTRGAAHEAVTNALIHGFSSKCTVTW
jgi:hypothetical protein